MDNIAFELIIAITLGSALMVVVSKQLLYSAIALLFTLLGIAGLYIFMWADFAERMFINKTSSATIILLVFLILMNAIAVFLRNKLERRW